MNYDLEIEIRHKNLNRENSNGFCEQISKNEFLIEIHNDLSEEEYIKTLLHEMTHVYQHARGDLVTDERIITYRGVSCQDLSYDELPHEIEARARETELYEDFLKA